MNKPSPDSTPSDSQESLQAGFSPAMHQQAQLLKALLLSGEKVPLEQLRAFLLNADKDLDANRVKKAKAFKEKPSDVNFF